MTTLTLDEIKGEIKAHLGNRSDADSRLNSVLNLSQTRLARLHDFDELRQLITIPTVITADPSVDKIVNIAALGRYRKIYSVRLYANNNLSRKLTKRLPSYFDTVIPEPEYYSRGTPKDYVIFNRFQMELYRVPDIVYQMHFRYSTWPIQITNNTQGTALLTLQDVDDVIIHLAVSYLNLSFGNMEKANQYYQIYAALAKEAFDQDVEDFDMHLAAHRQGEDRTGSRGYDDPFVRSMSLEGE